MAKQDRPAFRGDRPRRRAGRYWILLAVLAIIAAGLYGSALFLLKKRVDVRVEVAETTPRAQGVPDSTISLTSADGIPLEAWWIRAQDPRAVVVLIPGARHDASSLLGHARFLRDAGYDCLDLDLRAHGRSGGNRNGLSLKDPLDVEAALDWIHSRKECAGLKVALLGISMGGATALRTAALRPDVGAVISVSAFSSVEDLLDEQMRHEHVPDLVALLYEPFLRLAVRTLYGESPSRNSMARMLAGISPRRVLIGHGRNDQEIPPVHADRLAAMVGGQAELWFVDGAGHGIREGDVNGSQNSLYRTHLLGFLDRAFPQPPQERAHHAGKKGSEKGKQPEGERFVTGEGNQQ